MPWASAYVELLNVLAAMRRGLRQKSARRARTGPHRMREESITADDTKDAEKAQAPGRMS